MWENTLENLRESTELPNPSEVYSAKTLKQLLDKKLSSINGNGRNSKFTKLTLLHLKKYVAGK